MEKKLPGSFFGRVRRSLKKAITPAVSPNRSPPTGPSRRLPSEPLDPDANPRRPNLSPPTNPQANPASAQTSVPERNETKEALIGGLKTFLELGASISQGLPTQIPKAVFESFSYIIKMTEVRRTEAHPDMTTSDLSVRKTTADNARMLEEMSGNITALSTQLQEFLGADSISTELSSHIKALIE